MTIATSVLASSDIETVKRAHTVLSPATDLSAFLTPRTSAVINDEWDGPVTINLSRDHATRLLIQSATLWTTWNLGAVGSLCAKRGIPRR